MTLDAEAFAELGYPVARQLSTGEWAGVCPMIYTTGLFVGLDETGYRTRFCYPNMLAALAALTQWDGLGDPPGPWIKEKGGRIHDRTNPQSGPYTLAGIPIVEVRK